MGFETSQLGSIALLVVIIGAIIIYFLVPFFPRLPFIPGQMVESGGVMGTVDSISSFHTTIRKFDGTLVFLPNALVLASKILNYSYTPTRRIEMSVLVSPDSDLDAVGSRLVELVSADERVVDDPSAPAVYAMSADATGVQMTLYCWVANADFLGTRSDLWLKLVQISRDDDSLKLALPRQEILVKERS
jgi:small conductance mechanosensitive channel